MKGKLNNVAIRVPLLKASLIDCVFEVERETTIEEVHGLLRHAAHGAPERHSRFRDEAAHRWAGQIESNAKELFAFDGDENLIHRSYGYAAAGFAIADPMRLRQVNSQL